MGSGPGLALPAGYRLKSYDSLDSTNEEARRQAVAGAPDGTVIQARSQSAGRGRRGRRWESPAGNLYCSMIARPQGEPATASQLTFAASLALGESVADLLPDPDRLRYKWPNDVLVDGRKIAGILLESAGGEKGRLDWLVIGCGLNVEHFPAATDGYPATSLLAAGCDRVEIDALLAALVRRFAHWRGCWEEAGFELIREVWLARAAGLGEEIEVRLPAESLRGRFAGLDAGGMLLLELADGTSRPISAGDVFF